MIKMFSKNEKGSVTIITLTTILFIIAFLVSTYASVANKRQVQEQLKRETMEIYETETIGDYETEVVNGNTVNANTININTVIERGNVGTIYEELNTIAQAQATLTFIIDIPTVTNSSVTQNATAVTGNLTGYTVTYYYSTDSEDDEYAASTTNSSISGLNDATTYYVWAIARKTDNPDVKSTNYCVVNTGHTHTGDMLNGGGCYTNQITCPGVVTRKKYSHDPWNITYTGDDEVETRRCSIITYEGLTTEADYISGFSYSRSTAGSRYCNVCGVVLSTASTAYKYSIAKEKRATITCYVCGVTKRRYKKRF